MFVNQLGCPIVKTHIPSSRVCLEITYMEIPYEINKFLRLNSRPFSQINKSTADKPVIEQ